MLINYIFFQVFFFFNFSLLDLYPDLNSECGSEIEYGPMHADPDPQPCRRVFTAWSLACLAGPDSDAAGGAPLRDHQAQPHQPQPGYRTEFVLSELGTAQRQTVHALITERVC